MASPVALLTDFGTRDHYVGTMKGVILGIAPGAVIIDLTHEVAPQDVHGGAYSLLASYRYFPHSTIFCCVVDPGVGSTRRAVAVKLELAEKSFYAVLPDNGLLTPILRQANPKTVVSLDNPQYHLRNKSATFHGRDLFAPVAAHLAAGVPIKDLGPQVPSDDLVRLAWPEPQHDQDGWQDNWYATVLHIDHFGNLITNLPGEALEPPLQTWQVQVEHTSIAGISHTFADVAVGEPLAYIGSSGFLEIAVRQGNAQQTLHAGKTTQVRLSRMT
jgi:S-adenosylmethionine hydrolase